MLEIITLPLGELSTNCYLVSDPDTLETVIIDPADEGTFITDKILELKLQPTSILLTHGHFDHVLACLELKLNFNLPIMMNQLDNFLLAKSQDSAKHWLGTNIDPVPAADKYISEGDTIKIGKESLTVIHTPGHTPGSICLFHAPSPFLFSGDTLFARDIGRTDLSYSKPDDLHRSLKKLWSLPPETIVYPGHGDNTSIGQEKMLNLSNGPLSSSY